MLLPRGIYTSMDYRYDMRYVVSIVFGRLSDITARFEKQYRSLAHMLPSKFQTKRTTA